MTVPVAGHRMALPYTAEFNEVWTTFPLYLESCQSFIHLVFYAILLVDERRIREGYL